MPSETFKRLNKYKKDKLIEAAFKEFSLTNYTEVSINKIIKEAGISRGSFYMYFKDKLDLYFYLLEQYGEILSSKMKEELINNKGDIFIMFKNVPYSWYKLFKDDKLDFLIKSFENITLLKENNKTFCFKEKNLFKELVQDINLNNLTENSKNQLETIFTINMHLLIVTLIKLLKKKTLDKEILNNYYEQLNIIRRGSLKKEELC